MTDPKMDFRYTKDGIEVEAYQITDESRYQLDPSWLDSNDFLTIDGLHWIKLGGEELPLPQYGWIVLHSDGRKTIVPALEFETYVKVVPLAPDPMLQTAEAVSGAVSEYSFATSELLVDVQVAIELLQGGNNEDALKHLVGVIAKRVVWCTCAPGECVGADKWSCRTKSPLVQGD